MRGGEIDTYYQLGGEEKKRRTWIRDKGVGRQRKKE